MSVFCDAHLVGNTVHVMPGAFKTTDVPRS